MSQVQELITKHIDIWTAAETEKRSGRGRASGNANSVYGIKKLRELILELAVRGKLVPQDANDEPASELLKRIQTEKTKLITEGVIRKNKPIEPISDQEKSFELAHGWEWIRVGQIGHDWGQKVPDRDFTYIEVSAIDSTLGIVSSPEQLKSEDAPSRARKIVKTGTVIYSTIRPYLLNIAVIEEDFSPEPIASTAFAIVHPFCTMPARYFLYFFRSPTFVRYVESVQMGIAYPAINDGQFFSGVVPIPPLEEQHRIVAKVDELMALCDQLEAQHNNAAEAHEQLVSHLLGTLTQSQDAADFNTNWQRIATHFDTLFTTESSIDTLKQTLLQLAVMGKLVPQDPKDEPANELLKRILNEKLNHLKKIKVQKTYAKSSFVKSLALPPAWEEIEVQDFAEVRLGSTPSRAQPSYWGGEIPWVSSGEVANNLIMDTCEKISQIGFERSSVAMIPKGSLLIAIIGQGKTRGQSALLGINACTNQNVAALIFNKNYVFPEFAWIWAKSKYESHRGDGRGGAQPALNGNIVKGFRFSLPPIEEQHRIVAKVVKLMNLCDKLKTHMNVANQMQKKLAAALISQGLN